MNRPEPPRRLGGVRPGRSPLCAGWSVSSRGPGSAEAGLIPFWSRSASGVAAPLTACSTAVSSEAAGPFGTGLRTGESASVCLSVFCATSHSPERSVEACPGPEAGRSLVDQYVESVNAHGAPRARETRQRCAALAVDEVHHDLPIT